MKLDLDYIKFKERIKLFPSKKKRVIYCSDELELRHNMSIEMYGKGYSKLNDDQMSAVFFFTSKISELEDMLYDSENEVKCLESYLSNVRFKLNDALKDKELAHKFMSKTKKTRTSNFSSKTYLIKEDNTKFYKIGKSIDPVKREKTLQREKPNIKLIKVWEDDIERELHKKYKDQRVRGEWFVLSKIQVKHICNHYK
jgi:hypothetical protein